MIQYEITGRVPTGLTVTIYQDGIELLVTNVPADSCRTRAIFEAFLARKARERVKELDIPQEVLSLRGKRTLSV